MASNVRLIPGRLRQILRSSEVERELVRRGRAVAMAAGTGHRVDVEPSSARARVEVVTESFRAMQREASRRSLTRALDAARD